MNAWHLVIRELLHRKGSFLVGLLSMVLAVVCLTGSIDLVRSYDHHARAIILAKAHTLQQGLRQDRQQLETELRRQKHELEQQVVQARKQLETELVRQEDRLRKDLAEAREAVKKEVAQAQLALEAELTRQSRQFQRDISQAEKTLQAELAEQEEILQQQLAKLRDQIRRTMKGLGFNIYIFPEGQDLNEVYSQGYASKTMPESYVTKLANSGIMVVNHLLPSLTQRVQWTEKKRSVVLMGIRGEVPIKERTSKTPLLDPVEKGKLVLGYELHNSLGIAEGDEIVFNEKTFTVQQCHSERGSVDDITIWMNLAEAQKLLSKVGKINSILALECNCESVDRLADIRAEIGKILPGTKIIEKKSQALARAEARSEVARRGKELFERKQAEGRRLIDQKKQENQRLLEGKKLEGERLVAQKKADGLAHVTRTSEQGDRRLKSKQENNDALIVQKRRENERLIARKQQKGTLLIRQKTEQNTRLIAEKDQERRDLKTRRAVLAGVVSGTVLLGAGAWIALVMLANARERLGEVGILRAMGVRGRTVLSVFLIKACLMGLIGAGIGCGVGFATGPYLHNRLAGGIAAEHLAAVGPVKLLALWEAGVIFLGAPLLACAAAWLPAARAARQDPAVILQQE